jgi:hypothetical protein
VDHRNPFWIPCDSLLTTPSLKRMLMSFYHPIRNLRRPINFDVTSGFVSISDMFNDVCIFVNFMCLFCISSKKWCHLIEMCLVLGLFYDGSFAKCVHS